MISIVCIYNNEKTLQDVLLKGLKNQTVKFELIALDNTDNKYKSAAEGLNYGGVKAKGDYIMFVHQDMWLGLDSWLEDAEGILRSIPDLGVAGVAGMSEEGKNWAERVRFSIDVFDEEISEEMCCVEVPVGVQTLDECLLIVPRSVFNGLHFDSEVFDGWDCYGADYCLSVKQLGFSAYVIPLPCSHSCLRSRLQIWEFKELLKFQKKLYRKHKGKYKHIYTWMGDISWRTFRSRELMQLLGSLYLTLFPDFKVILKRELTGCNKVLDLGCGYHSPISRCSIPFSVGVELFEPYLRESKRKGIHSQYIKADIAKLEFKPKSFDAVIAHEVIEHLTKQDGAELLGKMEQWAKEKVIITTPNGYLLQDTYHNNPLQEHRSGWRAQELRELGFKVRGIDGWKGLRGYSSAMKYEPAFLWRRISDLTQMITFCYTKLAFRLVAIKRIKYND